MNTISDYKEQEKIGRRLKAARLTRGISQWQLCQKIGLKSAKILAKYENGTFRIPEDLVRRFAKELGVTADYILKGEQMEATVMEVPKPQIATAIVKPEVVTGEPEPEKKAVRRPRIDDAKNYLWVNGEVFCKILSDAHLTAKECAELVGLRTPANVYEWKKGTGRMPTRAIDILCDYSGVNRSELIDFDRNVKEPMVCRNTVTGDIAVINECLAEYKRTHAEEPVNPKTEITVTMEEPKEEKPMPEFVTMSERPIPANAEQVFCKNVKYYIRKKGIDENEFLNKVGAGEKYLDDTIKNNWKIPMAVILKMARELGISVEELATDNKAAIVEAEILELEKRMKDLRAMIGIA